MAKKETITELTAGAVIITKNGIKTVMDGIAHNTIIKDKVETPSDWIMAHSANGDGHQYRFREANLAWDAEASAWRDK